MRAGSRPRCRSTAASAGTRSAPFERAGREPRAGVHGRRRRAAGHQRERARSSCAGGRGPSRASTCCAIAGRGRRRSTLSTPRRAPIDERPVLAADRGGEVIACWVADDRSRRVRPPGGAVPALAPTRGATWDDAHAALPGGGRRASRTARTSAASRLAARRGAFSVAWVDTLAGTLDGSGLDSAWVARSDGPHGRAGPRPRGSGRCRERFAGDSFRNVGLLSLAAGRERALSGVRRGGRRSGRRPARALGRRRRWSEPRDRRATEPRDQFQPSVVVAGRASTSASSIAGWIPRARSPTSGSRLAGRRARRGRSNGSRTTPGTRRRRAALADRRPARRPPGAGRGPLRLRRARRRPASARTRARDRKLPRTALPQLFAWTLRASRRC